MSTPAGQGDRLADLGRALQAEGRFVDAETVFTRLADFEPDNLEVQRGLMAALGGQGRTLEALQRLLLLRGLQADTGVLLSDIQTQSGPAITKYNAHLEAGEVEQAEAYAATLAALAPKSAPMLGAALACNLALNRRDEIAR
jgi:tetratricopeptide (TPR) repeat protein